MGENLFESGVPPGYSHNDFAILDDEPLVATESEMFATFDRWIDGELAALVEQWGHMASPRAKNSSGWLDRSLR